MLYLNVNGTKNYNVKNEDSRLHNPQCNGQNVKRNGMLRHYLATLEEE